MTVPLLCLSLGLHWGVLQSVAWASMLVERARTQTLAEALDTTFDGQHPCEICVIVRDGKAAEKKAQTPQTSSSSVRVELCVRLEAVPVLYDPGLPLTVFPAHPFLSSRLEPPPLPPPRTV